MAIALTKRRIIAVLPESVARGTVNPPNATNDALPTIREPVTFTPTPLSVARPTLRLSLTPYPDTYPGVATCELRFVVELGGRDNNPQTDYAVPNWADCLRACGFTEVSNANGGAKPRLLQNVSGLTGTDAAGTPIRHGQALTGNAITIPGSATAIGDFFHEDDVLCVQETAAPTGSTLTTWTQTIGGLTRIATGTRSANSVVAFKLNSDVNSTETITIDLYLDGKRLRLKGCMGDFNLLMDHGDMLRAEFTFKGIINVYADVGMPGSPFELHKVAPTFLGKEMRFYEIGASPKFYGRDAAAGTPIVGSLNTMRIGSGNNVILRENSFDPSGISFALIAGRQPVGSFNPDEVLNSEFDWVAKFIAGTPTRFKAMIGNPGTVTTQDGNTIDVLAPGIQVTGLGDGDRDGIQAWQGQFKCTGGDYDPSLAGEAPGNDNELVLIHR